MLYQGDVTPIDLDIAARYAGLISLRDIILFRQQVQPYICRCVVLAQISVDLAIEKAREESK